MAEIPADLDLSNLITSGAEGEDEPEDGGEPGVAAPEPGGGFMSADQVQQMLDNQRNMITDTLTKMTQPAAPAPQQQQAEPRQVMPTSQEVRSAFETGDADQFIDVYNRGLQAVYDAADARVTQLERAGAQRIQQLAQDAARDAVPDEYRETVDGIMDKFGLAPELRTNKDILQVLTDAAKGRNLDAEVNKAIEARVRQKTQRQTADPTSGRQAQTGQEEEPIFSMGAMQALRNAGRTTDQHAQALGYANWEEFNKASGEKYGDWDNQKVPVWRKKLNERRKTGRRGAV